MKRFLSLLLVFLLCLGLCACNNSDSVNTDADDEEVEENEDNDEEKKSEGKDSEDNDSDEKEEKPEKDEQNTKAEETTTQAPVKSGLDVVLAYAYDRDAHIVVKNVSDKPILSFTVAFICFDKNGLPLDDNYTKGNCSAVNLMPGEKGKVSFYESSEAAYVSATVSKITYQGNEEWENNNVDVWYDNVIKNFTVDAYNDAVALFAGDAKKAETNEYVSIDSTDKVYRNQYSTKDDFDFTITNISDKDIAGLNVLVLEYDENGYAVSTSPYNTYFKNDNKTGGTVNLVSGATDSFTDDLFFVAECKQYKCIVSYIEFTDGTSWENPYKYEWLFVNNKSFN